MTFFEYEPNKFFSIANICEISFFTRDIIKKTKSDSTAPDDKIAGKTLVANIVLASGTRLPPIEGEFAETLRQIIVQSQ